MHILVCQLIQKSNLPAGTVINSFANSAKLAQAGLLSIGGDYCSEPTVDNKNYTAFARSGSGVIWSATNTNKTPTKFTGTLPDNCDFLLDGNSPVIPEIPTEPDISHGMPIGTVPYSDSFEDAAVGSRPAGWGSGSNKNSALNTTYQGGIDNVNSKKLLKVTGIASVDYYWVVSPKVHLKPGVYETKMFTGNSTGKTSLTKIKAIDATTGAAVSSYNSFNQSAAGSDIKHTFTVNKEGDYRIAVNNTGSFVSANMHIDDVSLTKIGNIA